MLVTAERHEILKLLQRRQVDRHLIDKSNQCGCYNQVERLIPATYMLRRTTNSLRRSNNGESQHAYRWGQASRTQTAGPAGHVRAASRRDDRPWHRRMAGGRCSSIGPRISPLSAQRRSSASASLKRDFADRDADLIGASTDTTHVHFAWRRSDEQLDQADFPWIADNKKELAEALGILDRARGRGASCDVHRRSR